MNNISEMLIKQEKKAAAHIERSSEAIQMRIELRKDIAKQCSDAKKACYGVAKTQTSTRVVDAHRREMVFMANTNETIIARLCEVLAEDVKEQELLEHAIAIIEKEEGK
jgi:hypothetical protein